MSKKVLSGMQSSGVLHLGNYIGAICNWKDMIEKNKDYQYRFMIADLHSLTSLKNGDQLRQNIIDASLCYLACGIDFNAENITLFQQSKVQNHAELAWIFQTITPMGWLERMTQFKDKSLGSDEEKINTGLFTYPTLMAADILLYQPDFVPVGEDQKQHIELTRDLAGRFNREFKSEIFKLPEPVITQGARIMSLTDGKKKMSKSDPSDLSRILLTDENDAIAKKIAKAKTDSIGNIFYDKENRPEISNLMTILSVLQGVKIDEIAKQIDGFGGKQFKDLITEVVIEKISPIREKIKYLRQNFDVNKALMRGNEIAKSESEDVMKKVRNVIGI